MQLMSIGRFSRLTGLGVKALRHYDEIGLLPPAAVDEETGYRFYAAEQVDAAEAIRRLRRLDLPLDEIRTVLAAGGGAEVRAVLVAQQRRLAMRRVHTQAALTELQSLIDGKESLMGIRSESLDPEAQRKLGVDLFNRTWTFLELPTRTAAEDDEMLHCAHASAYHWRQVGTPANFARSEWQCSRVYAVLGLAEPALRHAHRCLELVESSPADMATWDLAGAHEALARAYSVAGDSEAARRHRDLGREALARVEEAEDRAPIEADLATIPV